MQKIKRVNAVNGSKQDMVIDGGEKYPRIVDDVPGVHCQWDKQAPVVAGMNLPSGMNQVQMEL